MDVIVDNIFKPDKTLPLYQKCEPVKDFENESKEIKQKLEAKMLELNRGALGLAANQLGINKSVFVLNHDNQLKYFFNPKITDLSVHLITGKEGCLSFPGFYVEIKRPAALKIFYQDENGEENEEFYGELPARVIQHEMNHLEGIPFYSKATRFHLERAKKKYKKWKKKNK